MTHTMSHGFHACDSFEHMIWFMGFDWLTECCVMTHMSYRWISRYDSIRVIEVYVAQGDESPELGLWRCLYKALGSDQEIGSSRNHLSTFLYFKILQYDYTLLSLSTLLPYEGPTLYEPRDYCDSLDGLLEHRTIVIVLSRTTLHPSYYLTR